MPTKVIDTVLPEPTTAWGLHKRWMNHVAGMGQGLNPRRKRIEVK